MTHPLSPKGLEAAARAVNDAISKTDDAEHITRLAVAAYLAADDGWMPIETAPKDGTRVLLLTKNPIPRENRPDLEGFNGIQFVGRCHRYEDGADLGWGFAAPVGCGGLPDDWMVGWRPLPAPPGAALSRNEGGSE